MASLARSSYSLGEASDSGAAFGFLLGVSTRYWLNPSVGLGIELGGEEVPYAPLTAALRPLVREGNPVFERLGGSTVVPKQPVGAMGFTAYVKDPEGNVIGLWETAPQG